MQTKRDRLEQLRQQFDELTESLGNAGKKRSGTAWERDRLITREQVRKQIEDLEDIPSVPTYNPAADELYTGLEVEDETDQASPQPTPQSAPQPSWPRRFEPEASDLAALAEFEAAGAFRPAAPTTRKRPNRWGRRAW